MNAVNVYFVRIKFLSVSLVSHIEHSSLAALEAAQYHGWRINLLHS